MMRAIKGTNEENRDGKRRGGGNMVVRDRNHDREHASYNRDRNENHDDTGHDGEHDQNH